MLRVRPQDEPSPWLQERVIEMMSTLETVQAEIDYRRRAARQGIELENMRAARQALARLLPEGWPPAVADPGRLAPGLSTVSGTGTIRGGTRPEQDVGQLQLFDAVYSLLGELSQRSTVVLILEDLHWADGSTRG